MGYPENTSMRKMVGIKNKKIVDNRLRFWYYNEVG